uniref:Putative secreted protein n=1 Tax=Anopheles marajoara TaxID=58244 RepID=A0A2M4C6T1_9DIPT
MYVCLSICLSVCLSVRISRSWTLAARRLFSMYFLAKVLSNPSTCTHTRHTHSCLCPYFASHRGSYLSAVNQRAGRDLWRCLVVAQKMFKASPGDERKKHTQDTGDTFSTQMYKNTRVSCVHSPHATYCSNIQYGNFVHS